MLKKILEIVLWIALGTGVVMVLASARKQQGARVCNGITIHIDQRSNDTLITNHQLLGLLKQKCGKLEGQQVGSLDFRKINEVLGGLSPVISTGAYTDINGSLNIYIRQRTPILRIFTKDSRDYYLDEDGVLFWSEMPNTAYTLIASGNIHLPPLEKRNIIKIDTLRNAELIRDVFAMVMSIRGNDFLNSLIDQIYITGSGEVELIPKVGRQVILFGGFNAMEEKFENLEHFYRQGIRDAGWRQYKTINLKFKDQIVCSKI